MMWFDQVALLLGSALLVADVLPVGAVLTIIPNTTFDSQATFDSAWSYLYPWGSDHNGGARMTQDNVLVGGGALTLTATKVSGQPPAGHGDKQTAVNYLSGAVHAKEQFTVTVGGGYDFTAEFMAPTIRGAWPAFWLTAVQGWPPEIDMAEWKGSGKISFNTFDTSTAVQTKDVDYPDPGNFHRVRCELRDSNGVDVQVNFYIDDQLVTTQVGAGYVGKAMYL
ncbi:family 16 glycoside hydrolase [Colletotrichum cereale]|nr:family 16 glycoside hydrolase [Colletotrichum cereale]